MNTKNVIASFIKDADYPDHPDDVVISSKENFISGSEPITELDVWNYYSGVKSKMMEELKGRNIFLGIKTRGEAKKGAKPIYVRHPYGKKEGYITINSEKDFETYHSGRAVEYHITMPQMAPYYVIDFDAGDVPFDQTKKIVAEIADKLGGLDEVKSIELRYTGKRGFHVLGWLKKARDVNDSREFLHGWLKDSFKDRGDVVFGESPSGKQGALGLTCMKVNAGQIAKWSLRISGQCCVEIPRAELASFEHEDAQMDKVYKKATGSGMKKAYSRPLSVSPMEAMILKVVNSYVNVDSRVVTAGYDNKTFQPGYKGKFVIHAHDADKAGPHWDVRLEWPVTSLQKALGKYGHKGRGTDEPSDDYPDKPGTVYRSFVDKKRLIPTGAKKVFVVPTEDHPIQYGSFQGTITEGYGKGTVKIFDHGTYELMDRKPGRFTVRFHGNKLSGEYAFVKYNEGYLWVKTKDEKTASLCVIINKYLQGSEG